MIQHLFIFCATSVPAESEKLFIENKNHLIEESKPASNLNPIMSDECTSDQTINVLGSQGIDKLNSMGPPLIKFTSAEIQALSASSLTEIVSAFGPQISSSRGAGPPIFLIDGRRVENFVEIGEMPPEAISSITVYPEERAPRFGYSSNQKVINIVLRTDFRAADFLGQANLPLGTIGRSTYNTKVGYWDLSKPEKSNFVLNYQRASASVYNEADRDRIDVPWREPSIERLAGNASITRNWNNMYLKFVGAGSWQLDQWRLGPGFRSASLQRTVAHNEIMLGASIGGEHWWASGTMNLLTNKTATREADEILVSRDGYSLAEHSLGLNLKGGAEGAVSTIAAGDIYGSVGFAFSAQRLNLKDLVIDQQSASHSRSEVYLTGSIDAPLIETNGMVISVDGKIGRSNKAELNGRYGFGISGNPLKGLVARAAFSQENSAPHFDYLAQMVTVRPNAQVYDFALHQMALAERTSGGNKDLQPQSLRTIAFHADYTPIDNSGVSLSIDYTDLRFRNRISEQLGSSPQLEVAFPSRFAREASGLLHKIDSRRINIYRENSELLKWGVNIAAKIGLPFSPAWPTKPGDDAKRKTTSPSFGIDPNETTPMPVKGSIRLALYHTWTIQSSALLKAGSSRINLIHEQNVTDQGDGARHKLEFQTGYFDPRFGIRFSGNWISPHSITLPETFLGSGTNAIKFRKGIAIDFRAYLNLQALTNGPRYSWLKGRLSIEVENILGGATKAVSEKGDRIDYSRALSESVGPTANIKFRKSF